MQVYILAFIIALLASWVLTPYVKKLAFRIGALDKPDGRKVHHGIMPRLGGLAIYLAFVIAVLATMHMTRDIFALLLGGTVIVIVGILDDNSVPLTVFWIVSFTNVVNLMDGLDGLAAGVSGIASVTVILVALQQGFYPVAVITAALAGGIIGFIRYNFNPASIFMGDTGSMFIGYMLAAISIAAISIFGAVKSAATIALLVPAVALGLPIMDTAFAIVRRYTNGRPIFQPDKGHLHHRLLAMGLSQRQAVLLMYVISAVLGIAAILLTEVDGYLAAGIIACIISGVALGAKKIGILNDR